MNYSFTGASSSSNFPTLNAYNSTFSGAGSYGGDVFVSKLNATGNGLIFSTYLGGKDTDEGWDIAVDGAGNSYITGPTYSNNFPTKNAFDNSLSGSSDSFVAKLNSTGNGLIFSTYLGGISNEKV